MIFQHELLLKSNVSVGVHNEDLRGDAEYKYNLAPAEGFGKDSVIYFLQPHRGLAPKLQIGCGDRMDPPL